MELIALKPNHGTEITKLLNQQINLITPQFALSEHQIKAVIFDGQNPWILHYGSQSSDWKTCQYGILDNNQLVAAAQWEVPTQPNNSGLLSWIIAKPNHTNASQRLIQEFLKQLQAIKCNEVQLNRFDFGVGWLGIPDIWLDSHQALTNAKFWVHDTWIVWSAIISDIVSNPITLPDEYRFTWDIKPQKREWDLYVHKGDIEVGTCSAWGLPTTFDDNPVANQWMTIEYIEVKPEYRRQNIAQCLLQEQARFHAKQGIQNIIAWVQQKNKPALTLGEKMGFNQQFRTYDYNFTG